MITEKEKEAYVNMLKQCASPNREEAYTAQAEFAQALVTPLRQGVLAGDITDGIFERDTTGGTEYPLDLLAPGEEDEFVAYTLPNQGRLPERNVEGDYVRIPTFRVGNSIDWLLKYARDGHINVVNRALTVFEGGFTKKINDDAWHTLITAGVDRNIVVYDADAAAGFFTKRLATLMATVMRRNAGGNTTSIRKGRLTDMWISPEGIEDMRNWNLDQIDETTRREIYVAGDGSSVLTSIFGIRLHELMELGEGQQYQLFFTNALAASLQASDLELVVGLDLSNRDSFIMPVTQEMEMFDDPALHREQRMGYYGWMECGYAVLDSRRVVVGSF